MSATPDGIGYQKTTNSKKLAAELTREALALIDSEDPRFTDRVRNSDDGQATVARLEKVLAAYISEVRKSLAHGKRGGVASFNLNDYRPLGIDLMSLSLNLFPERKTGEALLADHAQAPTIGFIPENNDGKSVVAGFKVGNDRVGAEELIALKSMGVRTFVAGEAIRTDGADVLPRGSKIVVPKTGVLGVVLPVNNQEALTRSKIPHVVPETPTRNIRATDGVYWCNYLTHKATMAALNLSLIAQDK